MIGSLAKPSPLARKRARQMSGPPYYGQLASRERKLSKGCKDRAPVPRVLYSIYTSRRHPWLQRSGGRVSDTYGALSLRFIALSRLNSSYPISHPNNLTSSACPCTSAFDKAIHTITFACNAPAGLKYPPVPTSSEAVRTPCLNPNLESHHSPGSTTSSSQALFRMSTYADAHIHTSACDQE